MRTVISSIFFYTFSFFIASELIPGLKITGGLQTMFLGGFGYLVLTMMLLPILSLITYPLKIITFGMVSFFLHGLLLYILTLFIPSISIESFIMPAITAFGSHIDAFEVPQFFAFLIVAVVLSTCNNLLLWATAQEE